VAPVPFQNQKVGHCSHRVTRGHHADGSTSDISSDRFYPLPAFRRTISQTDPTNPTIDSKSYRASHYSAKILAFR
jgi:hypothetical protein